MEEIWAIASSSLQLAIVTTDNMESKIAPRN